LSSPQTVWILSHRWIRSDGAVAVMGPEDEEETEVVDAEAETEDVATVPGVLCIVAAHSARNLSMFA
jgi:hypothetical protein